MLHGKRIKKGILIVAVLLCGAGLFRGEGATGSEQQVQELLVQDAVNTERKMREKKLTVCISGAVVNPGIYKVSEGTRAISLIAMAGGATEDADFDKVNLAQKCKDGKHIKVPRLSKARKKEIEREKALRREQKLRLIYGKNAACFQQKNYGKSRGQKVNINRAGKTELETLPGVGPATAEKIIFYRSRHRFRAIEEIMQVPGISRRKYASMCHLLTL